MEEFFFSEPELKYLGLIKVIISEKIEMSMICN